MKVTREEAFAILELPNDASEEAVRKSFRKLALVHHPDKNAGCERSAEKFKMVSAAYARLTSDHQSDDELDDDELFPEELFEQMFGGSGMHAAMFMHGLFEAMQGVPRMRKGPGVKLHRPAGKGAKGIPVRQSQASRHSFGGAGGMPSFMRSMFEVNMHHHGESSSEWETDEEAEPSQHGASSSRPANDDADSSSGSEWETDNGSDGGDDSPPQEEAADDAAQPSAKT